MIVHEKITSGIQKDSFEDSPLTAALPVTIIRPSRGWFSIQLRELWE